MSNNNEILQTVRAKAQKWLNGAYDAETKSEVKKMLDNPDTTDLIDAFYKDLEFGTGGLRGIMGAGSNRMNIYTAGTATQGLSNYLNKEFSHLSEIKVVVGHDCRNNSRLFAETMANIFSANGITAYLFEDLRPTPEISFAIRKLGCQSGIIITASHNPKEYNGYKAYWDDGAQVIAPHDTNIIDEVNKIGSVDEIKFKGNSKKIKILGAEMDEMFLEQIKQISLNPEAIAKQSNLKIVFTPIHGTTVKIVPDALARIGFKNIIHVPEQDVVSGNFPTVVSPNPEEPAALKMGIAKAMETGAELVAAADPDGDRLGIAIRDDKDEFILVNGNQTATLLTWYMLNQWKAKGKLTGSEFAVKTIVTSELIKTIARNTGVECFDVYTGFKWIAMVIRELEGKRKYICGGEESYGFLPGDYVRDKDSVGAIAIIAEIAAWAKEQGKTLYGLLKEIYVENGFSCERLISIVRKGKAGADEIKAIMTDFRNNPPKQLGGSKVTVVKDYMSLKATNPQTGVDEVISQPATSDVLQFFTEDGSKISVRPSGTEPKIKFYFEVTVELKSIDLYEQAKAEGDRKIDKIVADLKLN
ncbi:MAG: phospho-sugar mutase [Cytophagaceae bacterium]|jgi:phosphoglucomutase|nr:phospho-sugar mutase [Cytophagaceae bacterium]